MAVKYPGLLVPEADKHQALYQGLLGMGSALSGGPSNAPVSFAQQLGRGGQSFNKSYQDRINQSKQDQMGNQKYQMQQAQMEAQKMKIEEAKEQKRLQELWANFGPENTSGPGGMGRTKDDALKAAFPTEYAKAQIERKFPTGTGSRPSSPIQNHKRRGELMIEFPPVNGVDSPQVRRFDDYVRATQYKDTGQSIAKMNPAGPPTEQILKTVPIEETPEYAEKVAKAKAIGGATGAELGAATAKLAALDANLPKLKQVVEDLKTLGETATYTKVDQLKDFLARQSGMPSSEGAINRAKFIARVKNNVLPQLRLTFGAAFTVQEGESLLATYGDPDLSPAEKNGVLDALIQDNVAEIKALRRQTNKTAATGAKPADMDQSTWDAMSDKDRALF